MPYSARARSGAPVRGAGVVERTARHGQRASLGRARRRGADRARERARAGGLGRGGPGAAGSLIVIPGRARHDDYGCTPPAKPVHLDPDAGNGDSAKDGDAPRPPLFDASLHAQRLIADYRAKVLTGDVLAQSHDHSLDRDVRGTGVGRLRRSGPCARACAAPRRGHRHGLSHHRRGGRAAVARLPRAAPDRGGRMGRDRARRGAAREPAGNGARRSLWAAAFRRARAHPRRTRCGQSLFPAA